MRQPKQHDKIKENNANRTNNYGESEEEEIEDQNNEPYDKNRTSPENPDRDPMGTLFPELNFLGLVDTPMK